MVNTLFISKGLLESKDNTRKVNEIIDVVNLKTTGIYSLQAIDSGQTYFSNPDNTSLVDKRAYPRTVMRKVIRLGALKNAATQDALHGIDITADFEMVRLHGRAINPVGKVYLPLPYASPVLSNNIEIWMDATKVYAKTGNNRTAYTICSIVIEYISF